ncbi:hypothetical protein Pelo_3998 [Pelomyxa schiedti]|nr:hypothetical protein Pelo_3998 [Pelomyxa schiedti]
MDERATPSWCHDTPVPVYNLRVPGVTSSVGDGKKYAIVFYNGSFNPFHPGHLETLIFAKLFLENELHYEVIGGYLSPCSPLHATRKLGLQRLETRHRMNICHLAVDPTGWVMVDPFESVQNRICPKTAYLSLKKRLLASVPQLTSLDITVFWLGGVDNTWYMRQNNIHQLLIFRKGFEQRAQTLKSQHMQLHSRFPSKLFFVVDVDDKGISSSSIRQGLQLDQTYQSLPSVLQYMKEHFIYHTPPEVSWAKIAEELNINDLSHSLVNSTSLKDASPASLLPVLEQLLKACSLMPQSCRLIKFNGTRMERFKGFRSAILRVSDLICSEGEEQSPLQPSSFVIKCFPIRNRNVAEHWMREFLFFTRIAPSLGSIRVPYCHFASPSLILLEDCSDAIHKKYAVDGCSLEEVLCLTRSIAEFHGAFWNNEGFADRNNYQFGWVKPANDEDMVAEIIKNFERFKGDLDLSVYNEDFFHFCNTPTISIPELCNQIQANSPHTLVHGDTWIHNWCIFPDRLPQFDINSRFSTTNHANPPYLPVFFDWQTIAYGCPLLDLATVVDTCQQYSPANQATILSVWYDTVCRCGADQKAFSWDQAQMLFKLCKRWSLACNAVALAPLAQKTKDPEIAADLLNR